MLLNEADQYFLNFPIISLRFKNFKPFNNNSVNKFICECIETNTKYFIKLYKNIAVSQDKHATEGIFKEIRIIESIHSTYVQNFTEPEIKHFVTNRFNFLRIKEIYFDSEKQRDMALIYEYCDSTLQQLFNLNLVEQLNDKTKDFLCFQLIFSIRSLHKLGMIHMNLSPECILLNNNSILKLSKFRLSCRSALKGEHPNNSVTEYNTLRYYKGPEIFLNNDQLNEKADIWSLGCLIYQIYNNKVLFLSDSILDHMNQIFKAIGNTEEEDLNAIPFSKAYYYLNGSKEWTEKKEITYHSRSNINNLIKSMLCFNPCKRISAEDALHYFDEDTVSLFNSILQMENKVLDLKNHSNEFIDQEVLESFWKKIEISKQEYKDIISFKEKQVLAELDHG